MVQLHTNQEVELKNKNSFLAHRFKAFIIDLFMIYMPILYIVAYFIIGSKEGFQENQLAQFMAVFLFAIINSILISRNKQSIGLRAYNICIINQDNSKLSFIKALIRFYLFLAISSSFIGLFIPIIRKDKQTLHDLILKTKAVKI